MAPPELRCLGAPSCVSGSGEPVQFRTRKHLALLIRLAVEPGKRFTRDYLTDLLWPSAGARHAAHSLAQALCVIRRAVGREPVLAQRSTVCLAEGAVGADVLRLDACDVPIVGGFLDGFEIPDARPFQDWRDAWRAKLLPRLRDCLVRQMDAGRRRGDFAIVERYAHILAELDPLSEDAVRGLIEARAWAGDRTAALKAYATYAARLDEDLGARPSGELVRMASLLREGRRTPRPRAVGERVERAEKRFEAEPLVGREPAFTTLHDAWSAARGRSPRIRVILGEPGLGKTTLANAFVSTCQLEGAVVARAQAYDAERELPFAVLAELVRQLTGQRAIGAADPDALSELSRVAPEICAVFPGVPSPVDWAPEITPLRLADALLRTLAAAAEECPVVVVVDDVHAADNASVAILHIVARKLPPGRLLLILIARPSELRVAGAAAALVADGLIDGLETLELEPLTTEASAQLVTAVARRAGAGEGEVPRDRILAAGRGNPLALELLTREWVAHGPESLLRDLEAVDTQPVAALGIPRAIRAVFERQVARLHPKTRAVLDLAAVLGRRLADLSLYRAADCTPSEAADGLARLREEGMLREVQGGLEFRNELIRAQAYYAVPAVVRSHAHCGIAKLLDRRVEHGDEAHSLEIAWHFFRGEMPQKGVVHALLGAEAALAVGAPSEAEQVIAAALSGASTREQAAHLKLVMARALLEQSKAEPALPLLAELHDPSCKLSQRDHAQVLRLQATAEYLINRRGAPTQIEAAARAVSAARASGDPELLVRALFEHARSGVEGGQEAPLVEARETIRGLLVTSSDASWPMAHYCLGYCSYYLDQDPGCAADSLRRAVKMLEGTRNLGEFSLALNGLGLCLIELFAFGESEKAISKAFEIARRMADDSRCSIVSANLCTLFSCRGRFDEAIAAGLQSVRLGRRAFNQPLLMQAHLNLAEAYMLAGMPDSARRYRDEAPQWLASDSTWRATVEFLCENASLALLEGDVAQALELVRRAEVEAEGKEHRLTPILAFHKWRVFRAYHTRGVKEAHEVAIVSRDQFRNRSPLGYFEAAAVLGWVEMKMHGAISAETNRDRILFEATGAAGRLSLLTAQGFLAPPPAAASL